MPAQRHGPCCSNGMTRILAILLTGVATGVATWWFRSQQQLQLRRIPVERGDVIFRNTPLAGTGE
jgi:hypothetical protein